jgi:glycogen operon protein
MRQSRNLMATLMLSQGVPMLLAGDEFLRTQRGNNNAWCQDNEISWLNWDLAETNADFLRFVREMIHLRKRHPVLRRRRFFTGEFRKGETRAGDWRAGSINPWVSDSAGLAEDVRASDTPLVVGPASAPGLADIHWHGVEPFEPDFSYDSHSLAFSLDGRFTGREHDPDYRIDTDFYVALSAWREPLHFRIPPSPTRRPWRRVVDTARASPDDFIPEGEGPDVSPGELYEVAPFAMLVLVSEA